ncbi:hypothetical protein J2S66_002889 [Saccharothrix longispora]|uniref:Uncharacterized protein n=1 Tax=Saccharothrix longispora TaxID=33920 RepID=A0ABU1PV30_9PSEU|nr:hypothetical protein [Saccharothrix longispora]
MPWTPQHVVRAVVEAALAAAHARTGDVEAVAA